MSVDVNILAHGIRASCDSIVKELPKSYLFGKTVATHESRKKTSSGSDWLDLHRGPHF
jgi:hypothetical protein